ncbi:hypothetical protein, partial [Pararobbsia alpina]|uniref:hypothetical protein n=1 Tax=Pararobbsia alpina TaxID=621374 RepID=UPI001C2EB338
SCSQCGYDARENLSSPHLSVGSMLGIALGRVNHIWRSFGGSQEYVPSDRHHYGDRPNFGGRTRNLEEGQKETHPLQKWMTDAQNEGMSLKRLIA